MAWGIAVTDGLQHFQICLHTQTIHSDSDAQHKCPAVNEDLRRYFSELFIVNCVPLRSCSGRQHVMSLTFDGLPPMSVNVI